MNILFKKYHKKYYFFNTFIYLYFQKGIYIYKLTNSNIIHISPTGKITKYKEEITVFVISSKGFDVKKR